MLIWKPEDDSRVALYSDGKSFVAQISAEIFLSASYSTKHGALNEDVVKEFDLVLDDVRERIAKAAQAEYDSVENWPDKAGDTFLILLQIAKIANVVFCNAQVNKFNYD